MEGRRLLTVFKTHLCPLISDAVSDTVEAETLAACFAYLASGANRHAFAPVCVTQVT